MSKRKKRKKHAANGRAESQAFVSLYARACGLAECGEHRDAQRMIQRLLRTVREQKNRALLLNDLGTLAAVRADTEEARRRFRAALEIDPRCEVARENLAFLDAPPEAGTTNEGSADCKSAATAAPPVKVAILSFLFNWPSTGGGIVHTVELARFLAKGGFEVRHISARFPAWGIGGVTGEAPLASEVLDFDETSWNVPTIQARFRGAVDAFRPDYVIITDSWNMKPLLAEAVCGYPFIMRLQAMECLCPLNNMRLLPELREQGSGVRNQGSGIREQGSGVRGQESGPRVRQCPLNQLANPGDCRACVAANGRWSGDLHRLERGLADVPGYQERLLWAMREAEAVLVVNPLTQELLKPFARDVRVVTAGMDAARFESGEGRGVRGERKRILFAGVVQEPSKGFHILEQACALLWQKRRDFELVATAEPAGAVGPFTRFLGWLSQEQLPAALFQADMVVLPAIGQEALGRTAVEAMAAGRPVVASRIGGLPVTVVDEVTGLLCEPGDAVDLAAKIERLLDDAALREGLGKAGRKRFEEEYSWDVIIERHYRPLLEGKTQRQKNRG